MISIDCKPPKESHSFLLCFCIADGLFSRVVLIDIFVKNLNCHGQFILIYSEFNIDISSASKETVVSKSSQILFELHLLQSVLSDEETSYPGVNHQTKPSPAGNEEKGIWPGQVEWVWRESRERRNHTRGSQKV